MGKIVKFCSSCDEGFAAKFAFCPNCGSGLQAFEMNPVAPGGESLPTATPPVPEFLTIEPAAEKIIEPVLAPVESVRETQPVAHEPIVEPELEIPYAAAPHTESGYDEPIELGSIDEPAIEEPLSVSPEAAVEEIVEEPAAEIPAPSVAANAAKAATSAFVQTKPVDVDRKPVPAVNNYKSRGDDGGFYVTVIEEKNAGQRNMLLLGAFALVVVTLMSALVYNIFSKDLDVGSINDEMFNAVLVEDVPAKVDEAPVQKAKNDAGGGGGGGREDKEETTKGDLADQTPKPVRPPDANTPRMDNPALMLPPPSTEGNRKFPKENDRWGDPNGRFANFSNGTGSGGGQGSGTGTGQGSGRGTGVGSGDGSGSGGGLGTGNGNGRNGGNQGDTENPPPPKPVGVTTAFRIISKPKAMYTDAARQNNYQGSVTLKITLLASGQVGSVSAVSSAPYGLTESAIAAAKRIVFEPQKVGGQAVTVTKTFQYSFSLY